MVNSKALKLKVLLWLSKYLPIKLPLGKHVSTRDTDEQHTRRL